MQACLTVGLLLWAAMGAQGPAHAVRLERAGLSISAAATRQSASPISSQREMSAGLRALRGLLPHPLLLLDLHAISSEPVATPHLAQSTAHAIHPVDIAPGQSPGWGSANTRAP